MQVAWLSLQRSLPGVGIKEFLSKGRVVSGGGLKRTYRWEVVRQDLLRSRRVLRPELLLRFVPYLSLVEDKA